MEIIPLINEITNTFNETFSKTLILKIITMLILKKSSTTTSL